MLPCGILGWVVSKPYMNLLELLAFSSGAIRPEIEWATSLLSFSISSNVRFHCDVFHIISCCKFSIPRWQPNHQISHMGLRQCATTSVAAAVTAVDVSACVDAAQVAFALPRNEGGLCLRFCRWWPFHGSIIPPIQYLPASFLGQQQSSCTMSGSERNSEEVKSTQGNRRRDDNHTS